MKLDAKETALLFKALGDENRLRILQQLSGGEKCACELLQKIKVTQPTLSHHMKILCEAEIVKSRREGRSMYYTIWQQGAQCAAKCLQALACVDANQAEPVIL